MPGNAGYTFWLGDSGNIEGFGESIFDLVKGLRACAIEHFPDSQFAAQYRDETI